MMIRKVALALLALTFLAIPLAEQSGPEAGVILGAVESLVMLFYIIYCIEEIIVNSNAEGQILNFLGVLLPIVLLMFFVDATAGLIVFILWMATILILFTLKNAVKGALIAKGVGKGVGNLHKAIGHVCSKAPGG